MHAATPLATVWNEPEPYDYLLKTNVRLRRRVQEVQREHGLSFKGAIEMLLVEALTARAVPNE